MGGLGSGMWERPERKQKVEETPCLDMTSLRRRMIVIPENWGGGKVDWYYAASGALLRLWVWSDAHEVGNRRITVQHKDDDGQDHSWTIPVDVTPLPFGNMRFWFVCPLCEEQLCSHIYFHDWTFGCRTCHGLVHDTSQRGREMRLRDQCHKLHNSLGGDGDLDRGILPAKPIGMHTATYNSRIKKLRYYHDRAKAHADAVAWPTIMRQKLLMYKYNEFFDEDLRITLD